MTKVAFLLLLLIVFATSRDPGPLHRLLESLHRCRLTALGVVEKKPVQCRFILGSGSAGGGGAVR